MSKVMKPIFLDETGDSIVNRLKTKTSILQSIVASKNSSFHPNADLTTFAGIQKIVQEGRASEFFNVGDQIIVPWTYYNGAKNITYQVPHDIVHIGDATLEDGSVVPAMYLQWHNSVPGGCVKNFPEALLLRTKGHLTTHEHAIPHFVTDYDLSNPGTYYIQYNNRRIYRFTLNIGVPEDGVICLTDPNSLNYSDYTTNLSGVELTVYSSSRCNYPDDIVENTQLQEYNTGDTSSLSLIPISPVDLGYACYGRTNWSQCDIRQWLNSNDSTYYGWWSSKFPTNCLDSNEENSMYHGFMSGYSSDFLSILKPIKVLTNERPNKLPETYDTVELTTVYDTFFLPAVINENFVMQGQASVNKNEGIPFDYWIALTNSSTPIEESSNSLNIPTYYFDGLSPNPAKPLYRSEDIGTASGWRTYVVRDSNGLNHAILRNRNWYDLCPVCAIC